MKNVMGWLVVCALAGFAEIASAQACPPGTTWTRTFDDPLGQTRYRIDAPCKVFVGVPFNVTLTVTDTAWPNADVGSSWALLDNGAVAAGGGFNWITTAGGSWQRVVPITYATLVVNHTLQFAFRDLGAGRGAHFWSASLIGALTVDPYPPGYGALPLVDAGPDLTLTVEEGASSVIVGTAVDPEGAALTYRWLEGDEQLTGSQPVGPEGDAPLNLADITPLAAGAHQLTLEATDGAHVVADTLTLTIQAPSPGGPVLAPVVVGNLPVAGHRAYARVSIRANAHDGSGGPVTLAAKITPESPQRPPRLLDRPFVRVDQATGRILLFVRTEPHPGETDRAYLVTITATDAAGRTATAELRVAGARAPR